MEYGADKYYKDLNGKKVICIDFDNTVCLDEWPYIGPVIPEAISVLKELQRNGHKLILFTQRSDTYPICCKELMEYSKDKRISFTVDILSDAIQVFRDNGIQLDDTNQNDDWEFLTGDHSRKVFADYFIDDHNVGMKYIIVENKFGEKCKQCDWKFIDEWFVQEGLYKEKVL